MFSFQKLLSMDEAIAQGTHENQSGRSGFEVRLNYQPLFGKMSPHSSPREEEDQRPDPGDGGNRAWFEVFDGRFRCL